MDAAIPSLAATIPAANIPLDSPAAAIPEEEAIPAAAATTKSASTRAAEGPPASGGPSLRCLTSRFVIDGRQVGDCPFVNAIQALTPNRLHAR